MSISTSSGPAPASSPLPAAAASAAEMASPAAPARVRLWPAILLVATFWAYHFAAPHIEMMTFVRWVAGMGVTVLTMLGFTVWWLLNKRIRRAHRLWAMAITAASGIAAWFAYDRTLGVFTILFFSLPCVVTVGTLWLLVAGGIRSTRAFVGLVCVSTVTWAYFTLLRMDGISGEQKAAIHWRWIPTAEELYLAGVKSDSVPGGAALASEAPVEILAAQPGDWTGFRGPQRDATARGVTIATDWDAAAPKLVWKQRVGPGWSSVVVVGERLFTQEQRGEFEAVVCLDSQTGRELWVHKDRTRFEDGVAGAGPRATPTFADGRIFSVGGKGLLNCLDAATGKLCWSRDFAKESGAKDPIWGFCSSPLVLGNVVVVYAGGEGDNGLLAYRADTGEPVWQVATGQGSYSSPHLAFFADQPQVLCLSDGGLIAVEPDSGKVLWQHGKAAPGAPISLQPHPLGDSLVLVPSPEDFGVAMLEVKHSEEGWSAEKKWASRAIHPSFNDFVIHDGTAYGFDEAIFACFDIATGKRRWKGGRYDHGQVLLVAEQGLLVIAAESGEVVLLKANPQKHEELCRFTAIEGKTWNHPALVRGKLFVRNAEELACYDLAAP